MPENRDLPIYEIEQTLVSRLREGGRLVVQAPTGSGKSTQIPQMLLKHGLAGQGEIVVLQPRRLAARMLARRVAEEMDTPLGGGVGYQIRLESRVSRETRIRFVTEGVLLRQMVADERLEGVAAVIFDEFHERHLYGDITLGRALQIQKSVRPDLKIVVMSATLDTDLLQRYLTPCEVVTSDGRMFPVDIRYLRRTPDFERQGVWDVAASELVELLHGGVAGDALVFMPGAFEIGRTVERLRAALPAADYEVLPLHGELPPNEQDRAVDRSDRRKIVVSTNVAETSLTIDGVRIVVDCGLARIPKFDANRGINTLLVEKISHASADQRSGRAGRTAPGICLRLWTEREHEMRMARELPEVRRLDLAEVVLTLKASGIDDVRSFPWIEHPDEKGLSQAVGLLEDLGAVSGKSGKITETGRRMLSFPLHPRYARMFLEAERFGCVRAVALLAALTQGRSFLLRNPSKEVQAEREALLGEEHESDFALLMRAWDVAARERFSLDFCRRLGIHALTARQVGPLFQQFVTIARNQGLPLESEETGAESLGKCLLAGFSDQLARRSDRGTLRCEIVHGRRGMLSRDSVVQNSAFLVATEISEIQGRGGEVTTLLQLCASVQTEWLAELFPDDFEKIDEAVLDPHQKRVLSRHRTVFRGLILDQKEGAEVSDEGAAAILAAEIVAGRIKLDQWDDAVEQWIARVNRLAALFPEYGVSPLTPEDRPLLYEQICFGLRGVRETRTADVWPALRSWLSPEQLGALDSLFPERYVLPNGRKHRIDYRVDGSPILPARIQDLYGIEAGVTVADGRQPLKIHVLAPNQRPIQVTDDLKKFWKETYPEIKPALSRRYPKHEWR